jgi:hypothetical protein
MSYPWTSFWTIYLFTSNNRGLMTSIIKGSMYDSMRSLVSPGSPTTSTNASPNFKTNLWSKRCKINFASKLFWKITSSFFHPHETTLIKWQILISLQSPSRIESRCDILNPFYKVVLLAQYIYTMVAYLLFIFSFV